MESYIVIEGKRIELPEGLVDHVKILLSEQEKKNNYVRFVENIEDFDQTVIDRHGIVYIGKYAVQSNLMGKCLVLSDDYEWSIINNPYQGQGWSKLLVATEK